MAIIEFRVALTASDDIAPPERRAIALRIAEAIERERNEAGLTSDECPAYIEGERVSAVLYPITLLEHKTPDTPATDPGAVVLRDFGPDHHDPNRYVTHWRNDRDPAKPGFSGGGYHDNIADAAEDYARRVRKNY